jgi:hypothetical protein
MLATFLNTLGSGPITVSADWGVESGASPLVSAARTLTVPAGNPGQLLFTLIFNDATLEYSINGGAYASVTGGETPTVTNGQTLRFRLTGASLDGANVEVYDNTTDTLVGSWTPSIT